MISITQLVKTYTDGQVQTPVLKGIDFKAQNGEFIAIMGRSGAGKSTFMYQMSLLDEPTTGTITIDGIRASDYTVEQKIAFRLEKLGYVFQDYALLPDLTAVENVSVPLLMQGKPQKVAFALAAQTLEKIGLGHRLDNLPSQLSGGEQQRVSIARAIAHEPKILFADEPTANLDNLASRTVMEIFQELNRDGQTIIMVTHEPEYAAYAKRVVRMDDGRIIADGPAKEVLAALKSEGMLKGDK